MSGLRTSAVIVGTSTVAGAVTGGIIAGPAGAIIGAKLGAAGGIQAALANKGEQAVDATGKKISESVDAVGKKIGEGVDAAGRKVEAIVDKTGAAIEKVGNVSAETLEKLAEPFLLVADIGSKIMLSGYAMQMGLWVSKENLLIFNEVCESWCENINCVSLTMTTISANTAVATIVIAIAWKVFTTINQKQEKKHV